MLTTLPPIQQQIYDSIANYTAANNYAPSFRDIGAMIGMKSTGHITYHLRTMREKGYITYQYKVARSITLLNPPPATSITAIEELSTIRIALQRMQIPEESIKDIIGYIRTFFV